MAMKGCLRIGIIVSVIWFFGFGVFSGISSSRTLWLPTHKT